MKKNIYYRITAAILISLSILSFFISNIVYLNGLPKELDFKGEGEKLKLPEKNVLIFGFLLFVIFGSNGIII